MEFTTIYLAKFKNNTRRAYDQAIRDFKNVTGTDASEANQSHFDLWLTNMKRRNLSTSTIRQRVSAISQANPTLLITLPKREFIEHVCLDANQFMALLSTIPASPSGNLDFALIALSTAYGLKNSQMRNLHWCQIEERNDSYVIHLNDERLILPHCIKSLLQNLSKNGKKEQQNQDNYIFTRRSERWRNLPNMPKNKCGPLSGAEINRRLKKYARNAKLEEKNFSIRALSYTSEILGREKVIEIIEFNVKRNDFHNLFLGRNCLMIRVFMVLVDAHDKCCHRFL